MESSPGFVMSPEAVTEATKQLDELATRVEKVLRTEAPHLTATAAGSDEVSQRVAATLNEVHDAFGKSSDQGITEIREVAATLRQHTNNILAADQGFVV